MRLLLDTHVVLWWASGRSLPERWVAALQDPDNQIFVSAATAWEVEIKKRSGKLLFSPTVIEVASELGFILLAISASDATLAGSLEWDHKDPFDRVLAAQAIENRLVLLTQDDSLRRAPGVRTI
jgi:PIN domain nuclease of toxin-antitoxin system